MATSSLLLALMGQTGERLSCEKNNGERFRIIQCEFIAFLKMKDWILSDISYTTVISFKTGVLTVGGVTKRVDDSNEDGYEPITGIYALENFEWSHIGDLKYVD
jgi:hypothetical protein